MSRQEGAELAQTLGKKSSVKSRGPAQLSQESWGPPPTPKCQGRRLLCSHRPLEKAAGWETALGVKHPKTHLQQLLFWGGGAASFTYGGQTSMGGGR